MTRLLHLSYDLRPRKNMPVTTAVSDIINQTKTIADVKIIDLQRVVDFKKEFVIPRDTNHLMVNSFGLPYGFFFIHSLNRAYKKILQADKQGIFDIRATDIIHAHKITFEGYIAYKLAIRFNTKLILTIRQTDAWTF